MNKVFKKFIKGLVAGWIGMAITSLIIIFTGFYRTWFFILFTIAFAFVVNKKIEEVAKDFKKIKDVEKIEEAISNGKKLY